MSNAVLGTMPSAVVIVFKPTGAPLRLTYRSTVIAREDGSWDQSWTGTGHRLYFQIDRDAQVLTPGEYRSTYDGRAQQMHADMEARQVGTSS
jgi:hypothetical protein